MCTDSCGVCLSACASLRVPLRVVCLLRIARRPPNARARSNPVPENKRALDYLVYGKFRFKHSDSKGVDRLGTEWVPVEKIAKQKDWGKIEDKFDETVRAMREGHDSDDSDSSTSEDSDEEDEEGG